MAHSAGSTMASQLGEDHRIEDLRTPSAVTCYRLQVCKMPDSYQQLQASLALRALPPYL